VDLAQRMQDGRRVSSVQYLMTANVTMAAYTGRYTAYLYKNGSVQYNGAAFIRNNTNNTGLSMTVLASTSSTSDDFELWCDGNSNTTTIGGAGCFILDGKTNIFLED